MKQHLVPFRDTMNRLVRLVPAPLQRWLRLVYKDTFTIGDIERLQVPLLYGFQEEHRAPGNLLAGDDCFAEKLSQGAVVLCRVILPIEFQQVEHVGEYDGWLRVPQTAKDLSDLQVDITSRSRI